MSSVDRQAVTTRTEDAMRATYADSEVTLYTGDCLDVLKEMSDNSVDAVVTDPPAGIAFMGKEWDDFRRAFGARKGRGERENFISWLTDVMCEVRRLLKPGGHALVWALPRTSHWTATALEDAGFEIRDCVVHLFGSGFPKSLDVSKAIDKAAGATREVVARYVPPNGRVWNLVADKSTPGVGGTMGKFGKRSDGMDISSPATEEAARWDGWGTALKPGQEHWWLVRKPLDGTVAANVLKHGTGALNIDGCRVQPTGESRPRVGEASQETRYTERGSTSFAPLPGVRGGAPEGRWPTNLVFSHSAGCVEDGPCQPDCPVAELDRQSGTLTSGANPTRRSSDKFRDAYGQFKGQQECTPARGADSGGASRFFPVFRYQAKAPTKERPKVNGIVHPTVKSLELMRWLCRLITPPNGVILDPFAGSGTTLQAARLEGFRSIGIEANPEYIDLIASRLDIRPQDSSDRTEIDIHQ